MVSTLLRSSRHNITAIARNQLPLQVEGDGQSLWTIMQDVLKGMGLETEHLGEKHAQEM